MSLELSNCGSFFSLALVCVRYLISFKFFQIFVEQSSLLIYLWDIKLCFCFIVVESCLFVSDSSLFIESFYVPNCSKWFFHYNAKSHYINSESQLFSFSYVLQFRNISDNCKRFFIIFFIFYLEFINVNN